MRLPEQFRSTSFRIAVAYSALFFVSTMAILGLTYLAATADALGTVRASLTDDMANMRKVYQTEGREELAEEVARRAREAPDDRFFLLVGETGERIAGNLPSAAFRSGWSNNQLDDRLVAEDPSLRTIAGFNSDNELRLLGIGAAFDGLQLMAARDAHALDETQEIIVAGLLWGGIVTSFLALAGGYVLSLGPTRRVDTIAETLRTILTGRFDVRLPRTGKRDEIDRMSGDINAMLDRIEVLVGSLKQVSTDIAHDLRTPLSRLRQKLERTRRQARTVEEYEATLDQAIGETDTIIETFNALLRIAQIEAGARREKFADVDLSALLNELFELFASVAEDGGHAMTARIEPGLKVFGDRDLLMQLFSNLIENAITHVPPPGRFELVAAAGSDDAPVVTVSDDGPGVPKGERKRIFQRLYRLDASRTTPGSGLGLSMAEAIADLHGAAIRALDNEPGLRMRVRFAATDADPETEGCAPAPAFRSDREQYETV